MLKRLIILLPLTAATGSRVTESLGKQGQRLNLKTMCESEGELVKAPILKIFRPFYYVEIIKE